MFYNYIMNKDTSCEISKKECLNNTLKEIDELMNEHDELIKDFDDLKKNLNTIFSNPNNEFLNLSDAEINNKLDNILNDTINDSFDLTKLPNQQNQQNQQNQEKQENNSFDCSNCSNLAKTDSSDIDLDNLETESESDSDCELILESNLQNKNLSFDIENNTNNLKDAFDISGLFGSLGNMKMNNLKFEEFFEKMSNLENLEENLCGELNQNLNLQDEENLKNMLPFLKQMPGLLGQLSNQINAENDLEKTEDLEDFIKNDNLENNENILNNSDTESYYKTDDEESDEPVNKTEKLEKQTNQEELEVESELETDSDSEIEFEEKTNNKSSFPNLGSLNEFISKKIGFSFNLFGSTKATDIKNVETKNEIETIQDMKHDESQCTTSDKVDKSDTNNKDVYLKQCEENKKMLDNLSQMMEQLGMNNMNIEDLIKTIGKK
jgi:hypothetical protein